MKRIISILIIISFYLFGIESSIFSSDLYGKNNRPAAETRVRAKVNRYRTAAKTVDANCNCNPGIYSVVFLTSHQKLPITEVHRDTVSMAQKDMRFEPSVLAVGVGATVEFPNLDPFFHNVFSYSKTKKFDLGKFPQGETSLVTFNKPGLVKVFCEIHSSMRAYVHVLETPYFSVSDQNGKFHISNITPGEYTLNIWQENLPEYSQSITVKEDSVYIDVQP